jgi:hypothetical protein
VNLIGYSFVSSVKIQSVRQSSEGKANKHFDGQLRGRCKSKSKHQKPPRQQPSADVGKPQTVFCLGASDAQKEPFAKGEKQNRIDPDDWKAVGGQGDTPVLMVLKVFDDRSRRLYQALLAVRPQVAVLGPTLIA